MAGRPKLLEGRKQLAYLSVEVAEEIWEILEAGKPVYKAAAHIGVTAAALTEWLEHGGRVERFRRARETASHKLVEDALTIADAGLSVEAAACTPGADNQNIPDAARDKLRVATRHWTAARWNRADYGESKAPLVEINLGTLHIDALRRAQRPAPAIEVHKDEDHSNDAS